jgi:uncharacterized protein (DUF1015 family)
MATLRSFRPYRYNPALFPDLAPLVAPPYDVIGRAEQQALYERHPLNVIRLILSAEEDPYTTAARLWREWREERYIVQEPEPCLVFTRERFRVDGEWRERAGFYAAVRLEPFAAGIIRPHERTFSAPKEDRLRLLRACGANLSPVFFLYPDRESVLRELGAWSDQRKPDLVFHDALQTEHRVWFVRSPRLRRFVCEELAPVELIIADGHHRYETALAYSEERLRAGDNAPEAGHRFVLGYLTSMDDSGLVVLPTHRVLQEYARLDAFVQSLEQWFELQRYPLENAGGFFAALDKGAGRHCLGVGWRGTEELALAFLRDESALERFAGDADPSVRALDVTLLDRVVLQGLANIVPDEAARSGQLWYTHSDSEALEALQKGAAAVFFMRPPRMSDILAVCRAGQVMPQKSTYFYPKLLSGLLFQAVDEPVAHEEAEKLAQMAK